MNALNVTCPLMAFQRLRAVEISVKICTTRDDMVYTCSTGKTSFKSYCGVIAKNQTCYKILIGEPRISKFYMANQRQLKQLINHQESPSWSGSASHEANVTIEKSADYVVGGMIIEIS